MLSVDIHTAELDMIIANLPNAGRELRDETAERIKDAAKSIVRDTAYRTGELYEGIDTDYSDPEGTQVVSRAAHSIYVHFGSSRNRMAPRPFLQEAVDQETPRFLYESGQLVDRAMRGA